MNGPQTTGRAALVAAHYPARFASARELARELNAAQVLGAAAADVWGIAEAGAVGRDAWRTMLAAAVDLVRLAGYVAPDDATAEAIDAVAADLAAACFGGAITPTAAADGLAA